MRINLRFGICVHTPDSHIGNLERVVVAQDDNRPLLLVLYPGRAMPEHSMLAVPVSLVIGISSSYIQIAASRNELAASAEKHAFDAQQNSGWELRGGTVVIDARGQAVGKVQGVVFDSDRRCMSHIMVHHQGYHMAPQKRLVPSFLIDRTTPSTLRLYVTADYDVGWALTDAW